MNTRFMILATLILLLSPSWNSTPGLAADKVRWKLHSAFPTTLSILGPAVTRISSTVDELSQGTFKLKLFEPGALIPSIAYFDSVAKGSIDAAFGSPGFNVGKVPALAFFTSVPFGPSFGEFNAWIRYGGGVELYDEIYREFGLKGYFCGMIPPEASGWFKKKFQTWKSSRG